MVILLKQRLVLLYNLFCYFSNWLSPNSCLFGYETCIAKLLYHTIRAQIAGRQKAIDIFRRCFQNCCFQFNHIDLIKLSFSLYRSKVCTGNVRECIQSDNEIDDCILGPQRFWRLQMRSKKLIRRNGWLN